MELQDIGHYFLDRATNPVIGFTMRCLGFTAVGLEMLLNEVENGEGVSERWGITLSEDQDSAL